MLKRTWMSLVLLAGLAGCDAAAVKRAEQTDSLISYFSFTARPVDAVRDMNDPFDAGKRLRGMLLIANAPFGGEEVYVKGYVKALGGIEGEPADADPGVRAIAARALAMHGRAEHVKLITPLLDPKGDRLMRLEAARALQRLHNPKEAINPLLDAADPTKEREAEVRAEACTALGQYAESKVLQGLIQGVDDDQLVVNRAAQKSLKVLTGEDLGSDRKVWLVWLDKTRDPFAGRGEYRYPIFQRERDWVEYLPFVSQPPNETAAPPAGMTAAGG